MERIFRPFQSNVRTMTLLGATMRRVASQIAPYEARAMLLWTATTMGFAGSAAIRRCPASAQLWCWAGAAVLAVTFLLTVLDREAWEADGSRNQAQPGWDRLPRDDQARSFRNVALVPVLVETPPPLAGGIGG
jgi:hypothetical protein